MKQVLHKSFTEETNVCDMIHKKLNDGWLPDIKKCFVDNGAIAKTENEGIVCSDGIHEVVWFVDSKSDEKLWMPKEEYDIMIPVLKSNPIRIKTTHFPNAIQNIDALNAKANVSVENYKGYLVRFEGIYN